MIYVFDTTSLSTILKHYYREDFPTFWQKLNEALQEQWVLSVHECEEELKDNFTDEEIQPLRTQKPGFFAYPEIPELVFIRDIYSVPHFRAYNLEPKKLLRGGHFADPFVIAKAHILNATVVTEEVLRANAAKIPNICEHFTIPCMCLRQFMQTEHWIF